MSKTITELFGHQQIARKAISLAKRANPHLDTTPFLSLDERRELHGAALRALDTNAIRISWTMSAVHARPATKGEKAVAAKCLDWMLLADAA